MLQGIPLGSFALVLSVVVAAATQPTLALAGNGLQEPGGGTSCPLGDVTVVAARGSGESRDLDGDGLYGSEIDQAGRYGAAVYRELTERAKSSDVSVGLVAVDYEAIPVEELLGGGGQFIADYVASVTPAVPVTVGILETIADTPECGPNHPVVLVGYSQGAHVMQLVLEGIVDSELVGIPAAVGLFANPMFTWSDASARGSFPPTSTGIASLFVGAFRTAPIPSEFSGITRTWCLAGDIVCDFVPANLATTFVHTGSAYGVTGEGTATGPGTALSDILNTVEWALRQRGVLPGTTTAGTVTGVPSVVEQEAAKTGNEYWASLWVSAANIVGSSQPISGYAWDLEDDGDFELSGEGPILETSFERIDNGGESDTQAVFRLQVIGPVGLNQEYEICWDVKLGEDCGTRINSFHDDDGSIFESDIEWLSAAGITRGCNPPINDRFCPNDPVTRGQMAAFLVRALGLTDDGGGSRFVDDNDSVFETDIAKLAAAGITRGCNPPVNDRFCPNDPVTRGQMAAFLVRALGYTDNGGGDLFTDDDGSIFESAIDKLATAGVTRGCNPPVNDQFCPTKNVTRGQMAAFLRRALGG